MNFNIFEYRGRCDGAFVLKCNGDFKLFWNSWFQSDFATLHTGILTFLNTAVNVMEHLC